MGVLLYKLTKGDLKTADGVRKFDVNRFYDGTHETLFAENGEADLHKDFSNCGKIHSHNGFVQAEHFSEDHIPFGYHDPDIFEFIKVLARLTIRVSVRYTSPNRPEFYPGTESPFPFYNNRGEKTSKYGSGRIYSALKYAEKDGKTCQCSKCLNSENPSKVWWEVIVFTATHVVFDDLEARQSTCRLFFDSQDSPVINLDGMNTIADIDKDRCWLICATCDDGLVKGLKRSTQDFTLLCEKLYIKYSKSKSKNNLTIIVSHPHWCSKQISIGRWFQRVDKGSGYSRYTYTTSTCPGSSGAWVYILGSDVWLYNGHVHSGVNSEGSNYSGAGRDFHSENIRVREETHTQ